MPYADPERKREYDREWNSRWYHSLTWPEREAKLLADNKRRRRRAYLTKIQRGDDSINATTTATDTLRTLHTGIVN